MIILHEPDVAAIEGNMRARGRGVSNWDASALSAHARKNALVGAWLRREAERRGVPVVASRPREDILARVMSACRIVDA